MALQTADDAGDEDTARRLRTDLITDRLVERTIHETTATTLDLALLMASATDLRRQALHEPAALLYGATLLHAEALGDPSAAARARIGAAHCLITQLDLESAADLLAAISPGLDDIEVERLHALGRLDATRGALGSAAEYIEAALASPAAPTIVPEELAILLAEIWLDRGDFAELYSLRGTWATKPATGSVRLRWRVLEGIAHHLQGRLGTAERILHEIVFRPHPLSMAGIVDTARWHLVQVLGLLNRLDEAHAILDALVHDTPDELGDHTALYELLDARRSPVPNPARRMPGPRADSEDTFEEPPELASRAPGDVRPTRRHERVAIDWAEQANRLQLHLHRGELDDATELLGWLSHWQAEIDSPLVAAHFEHLFALIAEAHGHRHEALTHARAALGAYEDLGMIVSQWNLCRLCCHILAEPGEATSPELEHHQDRATWLLAQACADLGARDRITFRLNKWTQAEERISAACRACPPGEDRTARAALQSVVTQRLWGPVEEDPEASSLALATAEGDDVFTLARLQSELWRGLTRARASAHAVSPRRLRSDTAVAHYVVLPDRVELFLIHGGRCRRIELPATPKLELWELVRRSINKLRHYEWQANARDPATLSQRLGLATLADCLPPKVKHLVIIPDGALAHVPFCALPLHGEPLVMRFSVCSSPRWQWARATSRSRSRYRASLGVAATQSVASAEHPTLPGLADELDGLTGLSGTAPRILVDRDARKAEVLAALQRSNLAHIACHGKFDAAHPHRSGLLLYDDWLTIEDLRGVDLRRLRLAIVAACEGATSLPLPGAEAIGLPVALLLRGASAVMTALWEIPHEATREFMRELHSSLQHQGPVDAMTTTQRAWYTSRQSNPTWCGYVLHVRGLPQRWWAGLWPF